MIGDQWMTISTVQSHRARQKVRNKRDLTAGLVAQAINLD